jgi:hypothetical protein
MRQVRAERVLYFFYDFYFSVLLLCNFCTNVHKKANFDPIFACESNHYRLMLNARGEQPLPTGSVDRTGRSCIAGQRRKEKPGAGALNRSCWAVGASFYP